MSSQVLSRIIGHYGLLTLLINNDAVDGQRSEYIFEITYFSLTYYRC